MPRPIDIRKEQVIATIKELAAKLERRPTLAEVCSSLRISVRKLRSVSGSYSRAIEAAGLTPILGGFITIEQLFQDWIAVTRKFGRIPTVYDYEVESKYSMRPLRHRFGNWKAVPGAFLQFGDQKQLWGGWEDVREMAAQHVAAQKAREEQKLTSSGRLIDVSLTYGEPLSSGPLATAPTQEMGVMLLFGWLARQMGFVILKTQGMFPDCEALRRVEEKKWLRVWIEFEFESRNFVAHGHDAGRCDLIVCWEHNWAECPLEVIELKKVMAARGDRVIG